MHKAEDCPDRVANALAALVDIHLLAACDSLIVEEDSTFAYLARLLSEAPPSRIYNFEPGRFLPRTWRHKLGRAWLTLRAEYRRRAG